MQNDNIFGRSETLSLGDGDISYQDWDETLVFPTSPRSPETLNAAENGTSMQRHLRWVNSGETGSLNTSNVHSKKAKAKKRNAADMEQVTGKSRTDKYWARSQTVLEKGKELEALTDAYVIVYTARPERVKDGKRRLFISGNLDADNMGSELAKRLCQRISKAMDDVNDAAIELAELSRLGNHQRKKARSGTVDGDASLDPHSVAFTPSIPQAPQMSILCPSKIRPSGHTINLIHSAECDLGTSGAHTASEVAGTQLWQDKSELLSRVQLLSNNSKEIQLFSLGLMRKLVSSDCGVHALHEAEAVPRLVELLDMHSTSAIDVVCESTLVLSRMALYQHPCMAMVNAGAIEAFSRLLSRPLGDRMLVIVATTIGHCAAQHRTSWDCHERFSRDVLQPLINLLLNRQADVWLAAAMAICHITVWRKKKITEHLYDEHVQHRLGRLFSKCTTGLAMEKVALSISRIFKAGKRCGLDCHNVSAALNDRILPRLSYLLSHGSSEMRMGAIRTLRSLARTKQYWDKKFISAEGAFFPKLTSLLTSDNNELFVEAAHTAVELAVNSAVWSESESDSFWVDGKGHALIGGSEFMIPTVFHRLIRLLSVDKGWIVERAALALGKIVLFEDELRLFDSYDVPIAVTSIDLANSAQPLTRLVSSNDLGVVRAAIRTIGRMRYYTLYADDGPVVVVALFNRLARDIDNHALLKVNLSTVAPFDAGGDRCDHAGAIRIVVRLLTLQTEASVLSIGSLRCMLQHLFYWSDQAAIFRAAFMDANGARPLLQWFTNLPMCREKEMAIDVVLPFIRHSRSSRMAFRAAGAEQLLSDYLSIWHDMFMETFHEKSNSEYERSECLRRAKEAADALDLLRSEPEY